MKSMAMEKISLWLAVMRQSENFMPKILTGETRTWASDKNFFVFPAWDPSYLHKINCLKGYQYLQRIEVFYYALTCNN